MATRRKIPAAIIMMCLEEDQAIMLKIKVARKQCVNCASVCLFEELFALL